MLKLNKFPRYLLAAKFISCSNVIKYRFISKNVHESFFDRKKQLSSSSDCEYNRIFHSLRFRRPKTRSRPPFNEKSFVITMLLLKSEITFNVVVNSTFIAEVVPVPNLVHNGRTGRSDAFHLHIKNAAGGIELGGGGGINKVFQEKS